jgi:hypothetical protein
MAKKKKKYSLKERRAYWVGVGIASRSFNETDVILNNKDQKIASSALKGFSAVDKDDLNHKYFGGYTIKK